MISKALNNSYVSHDEFVSVNVLKECNEMKEEIKNPKTSVEYITRVGIKKKYCFVKKLDNPFITTAIDGSIF